MSISIQEILRVSINHSHAFRGFGECADAEVARIEDLAGFKVRPSAVVLTL
jgi:hypothetical protein